tara:strand:+ start:2577 stop:3737 length:1161 start_codon:yes stop_codon:yes gene_type:complete
MISSDFKQQNIEIDNHNNAGIAIEKLSDLSDNEDQVDIDIQPDIENSASIGLDLLANSSKMINMEKDDDKTNQNHQEIDLINASEDKKHSEDDDKNAQESSSSSSSSDNNQKHNLNVSDSETNYNKNYTESKNNYVDNLDDIVEQKKKLLYEFERLKKRGIPIAKHFTLASNLDEMQFEFDRLKKQREVENSIMFSRKMLMAFVTAVEFLNNRFDPFELKLDGWSEQVHEGLNEYDDIFEELHEKYKSTGKVSPEIKLLLTLGGSAFMFHLTNNIFKSSISKFENVAANNPDIINEMMNKNSPQQPQSSQAPQMDIGNILGMMSNMSSMMGNMQQPPPMNHNQSNNKSMDGPQGVDTLLESLSINQGNTKEFNIKSKKKSGKGLDL